MNKGIRRRTALSLRKLVLVNNENCNRLMKRKE